MKENRVGSSETEVAAGGNGQRLIADVQGDGPNAQRPAERQDGEGKAGKGYRRNGNVARLPKVVRDRVNRMIEDGVTYREIIENLGEDGKGVDASSLSRWKDGGYQDWLAEQAFIQRTRERQETPSDLVRGFDGTEVNHAALQLGSLHVFEALRDLGPGSLDEKLGGDCAAFARLMNALARASRETMQLQKYREACALARAALAPMKDPKRKLTEEERRAIVLHVDEILGLNLVDPRWAARQKEQSAATGIIRLEGVERLGGPKSEGRSPKCGEAHESDELHELEGNGSKGSGGDHGTHRVHGNGAAAEELPIEPEPLDPNAPVF